MSDLPDWFQMHQATAAYTAARSGGAGEYVALEAAVKASHAALPADGELERLAEHAPDVLKDTGNEHLERGPAGGEEALDVMADALLEQQRLGETDPLDIAAAQYEALSKHDLLGFGLSDKDRALIGWARSMLGEWDGKVADGLDKLRRLASGEKPSTGEPDGR